jgi:hypothetical protein
MGLLLASSITGSGILSLVVWAVLLVLVVVFAQWVIGRLGLPANIAQIVVVLIGVLALVLFLRKLLPVLGFGGF